MNRRQEIAAWFFGLLIALGLLVTDNGIWALVVLASLTILSLRDRYKRRKIFIEEPPSPASGVSNLQSLPPKSVQPAPRSVPPAPDTDSQSAPRAPDTNSENITPHLLAVAVLHLVRERAEMWKTPDIVIPEPAASAVAIVCQHYEIQIFLDLLKQRFGSGISKLVEASFANICDKVDGFPMFLRINEAILRARSLGPTEDGPTDPQLRLDLQLADQILGLVGEGESDEERWTLRFQLAQSLGRARISAEHVFPKVISRTVFDPSSIVLVTQETAYKGITRRWSETPGCFERHLQRKEGNALFPISERQPTDDSILQAYAKDKSDLEALREDVQAFFERAEHIPRKGFEKAGVVIDWLQYEVSPLLTRAAEIGEPARKEFRALEHILDGTMKSIDDVRPSTEMRALRDALLRSLNVLLRQIWRNDTPIDGREITSTVLCESIEMIRGAIELLEEKTAGTAHAIYQEAIGLLEEAAKQGFVLPAAEEKLALLRAFAEGTRSSATTK